MANFYPQQNPDNPFDMGDLGNLEVPNPDLDDINNLQAQLESINLDEVIGDSSATNPTNPSIIPPGQFGNVCNQATQTVFHNQATQTVFHDQATQTTFHNQGAQAIPSLHVLVKSQVEGIHAKKKLVQQQLVLLLHAQKCLIRESQDKNWKCSFPHCQTMKDVLIHVKSYCQVPGGCAVPLCSSSRRVIGHWKQCIKTNQFCDLCEPVKQAHVSMRMMT